MEKEYEKPIMLDMYLTYEERTRILEPLLGLRYDDDVLLDKKGNDFFDSSENDKFNFSTLRGIIVFLEYRSFKKGRESMQMDLKNLLNI